MIDPDTGSYSTASLPTVLLGQEKSSTFPVCSITAWIEISVRSKGAVHCPATVGSAGGAAAFGEGRRSRPFSEPVPANATAALPASRNLRRPIRPSALAGGSSISLAGSAAAERAADSGRPAGPC